MPPGTIPNPTKKKIRPSSASANIQTYEGYTTGLYDAQRPAVADGSLGGLGPGAGSASSGGLPPRPKTQAGGPRQWGRARPQTEAEALKPQRRLTLGHVDGIGAAQPTCRPGPLHGLNLGDTLKGRIEEKISIETLEELKRAFEDVDLDDSGKLDLEEFKLLLKQQLNIPLSKESQIDALFHKIDWSSEGRISWDEFCTYMQLEYAEKEDSYVRAKEVAFHLPALIRNMPHREPVLRIRDTPDGSFMACSQDGLVTYWSGNNSLKRQRSAVPPEMTNRMKPKWITDFVIMEQYNKIIIGTGDREIQFFELSSFEPYCQINGLETVPLKLDYCPTDRDECLVLFGDSLGCVNILVIQSAGECLRTWKKSPKAEGIASIGIDTVASGPNTRFIRWKVHEDWVQQLKYYPDMRQVISCSNHSNTALVIGCIEGSTHVDLRECRDPAAAGDRQRLLPATLPWKTVKPRLDTDQSIFNVYKGVKCFAFSKDKNILVTGGMDRIVRLWNPYVSRKHTGILRGHNAPIFYLFIAEEENRIFSISTDKCIKVWDIQDQNCLITVRPKGHRIRGDLQACHYSNVSKTLAVATDQMNMLALRLKPVLHADIAITHKEPIHAVVYNPHFKQIVTCSDGSVIKVWDFETGNAIFEYGDAHKDSAITCMSFDNTGRRLITGGRDGCVRIWNYNNGHCLRTMMKEQNNEEICAITYVELNRNRYVVVVGWDKRVHIYNDSLDGAVRHVERPLPKWPDDVNNGHREDILSVAQCPPNLLATSSYDGEVIVWNMVSGHIFCHLVGPAPDGYTDQALDGDMSVNKLLFLRTRVGCKESASLVASGPRGHLHFWNVYNGGQLMAQFPGSRVPGAMVTAMEVTGCDSLLFTADSHGFIFCWNIEGFCAAQPEEGSPELVTSWRGHIESTTCMQMVAEHKMLVTSSLDCTVRLWTYDGEYVGTFGQSDPWDVFSKSSFQHPMVPYDVLVDPLSLPDHPVLEGKANPLQIIHGESDTYVKEEQSRRTPSPTLQLYNKQQPLIDDGTIADMIKERPFANGSGKRLRHEQRKPVRRDRGGPSEYQMLEIYQLDATKQPNSPRHLNHSKAGPLDFYSREDVELSS